MRRNCRWPQTDTEGHKRGQIRSVPKRQRLSLWRGAWKQHPHPLDGTFGEFRPSPDAPLRLEDAKLLAPTVPTKIISVGPNDGRGYNLVTQPMFWTKPATCVNDPEGTIELPPGHPAINHEVELAVVIGKHAKMVEASRADDYIFGYTCMNDVTAGDLATDGAFMKSHYFVDGKIFDGFAPLGPWIETDLDTSNLRMECRVNGEVRQSASTSERFLSPAQLVAMISNILTLLPGDVTLHGVTAGRATDGRRRYRRG